MEELDLLLNHVLTDKGWNDDVWVDLVGDERALVLMKKVPQLRDGLDKVVWRPSFFQQFRRNVLKQVSYSKFLKTFIVFFIKKL